MARRATGRTALLYLRALRAFSLPVSTGAVVAAAAIALPVRHWRIEVLALSVAAVGLFHAAGNLFNDFFDFLGGVDTRTGDDEGRPGRLLVAGLLTPREIVSLAVGALALALILTARLVMLCGVAILAFAVAAALAGYVYTGPPFNLKRRGWGEALVAIVFGPALMLGAAYAQTGLFDAEVALLSLPIGLAVAAILLANNIRDRSEDLNGGVRTLAARLSERWAGRLYLAMVMAAALIPAVLAAAGRVPAWLLGCPVLLMLVVPVLRAHAGRRRLPDADVHSARFATALLGLYAIGYLLDQVS